MRQMNVVDLIHLLHGIISLAAACGSVYLWYRGGFWVPRFVHAIAFGGLIVGVAVTLSLPPPANPDPWAQFVFPMVFPAILVSATYIIAIGGGFVNVIAKERLRRGSHEKSESKE